MTRQEAQEFINAIVAMRNGATDEQALSVPNVYPTWREGVSYTANDRVRYNGVLYKVLQPHTSQATWTPDTAHSLFAKVLNDTIREWEQPDSTNPYMAGDKVKYGGKVWISIIDNNVWSPSVYGWEVV